MGAMRTGGGTSRIMHPVSRRGSALVWIMVVMVALAAFCSLAVDVGRVQLAKAELRLAADAAARHGAQILHSSGSASAARTAAVDSADDNTADGRNAVELKPNVDVRFGTWDAALKKFTVANGVAESSATAIEVTARRTAARGNPVKLAFAGMVGRGTFDVTAKAVARINTRRPGIVGLDYILMNGSSSVGNLTDSFRSKAGGLTGTTPTYSRGSIQSNGTITLSGNTRINGDVRPGVGRSVSISGGASVSGSTTPLAKPLDYPAASAGTFATSNNNVNLPTPQFESDYDFVSGSATLTIPAGNYYVKDLYVGSSGTLNITGAATFYVTGSVRLDGTINNNATPSNFRVVVCSAQDVLLAAGGNTYADIYAPTSLFKMGGNATLAGSVIARAVDMGGSARVIFDESLTVSQPGVSLVQ